MLPVGNCKHEDTVLAVEAISSGNMTCAFLELLRRATILHN
jgi:hypothetical protein